MIQSLFLTLDGVGPTESEILSYCDRLTEILDRGGRIDRVQIYTVARRPAEEAVGALSSSAVDTIAELVRAAGGSSGGSVLWGEGLKARFRVRAFFS